MKKLAYILPLIAGILLGTNGYFVRTLYEADFDAFAIFFARAAIAVVIIGICMHFYDRSLFKIQYRDLALLLACGLGGTLLVNVGNGFAAEFLTLSFASALFEAAPVFALVFMLLMFKEKPTSRKLLLALMAIAGCVLASGVLEGATFSGWGLVGLLAGIGAGLFYGLGISTHRKATRHGYRFITIMFYGLALSVLLMFTSVAWYPASVYVAEDPVRNLGFLVIHSMVLLVFPCTLFSTASRHVDPGRAAVVLAVAELLTATFVGYVLYDEVPSLLVLIGLALVVIAIIGIGRPSDRPPLYVVSKARESAGMPPLDDEEAQAYDQTPEPEPEPEPEQQPEQPPTEAELPEAIPPEEAPTAAECPADASAESSDEDEERVGRS